MNTSQSETLINHTFSGIAFYHRDTNLSPHLVNLYKVNHIIQHPSDLAVSNQTGGLTTNTRYVIASAFAKKEVSKTEKFFLEKDAFFKVIDIMVVNQKTQILLLHLPTEAIEVFTHQAIPFEGQLMETHRQIFIEHTYQAPITAIQKEEWLNQTAAPIGINEMGDLYYSFTPPAPKKITPKKVNQFKTGADPDAPKKKSFWQRIFK